MFFSTTRGVVRGNVRELKPADDVADRIDPLVARAQPRVHLDALVAVLDASGLEPEAVDIRAPAGRNQNVTAGHSLLCPGLLDRDRDPVTLRGDAFNLNALAQLDALGQQPLAHDLHRIGVIFGQEPEQLEHSNPRAQAPMRLSELAADRTTADHDQMLRPLGQFEDRLVGQVRHLGQTRKRRHRRRRAGRHHDPARLDAPSVRLQLLRPDEACACADHVDPEPLEALLGIVRCDGGDHAPHVVMDPQEIDLRLMAVDPEAPAVADGVRDPARRDQRLGRHAAIVQAVAPHPALLDQHHPGAHLHGAGRHRQAARARADDAQVGRYQLCHRSGPSCSRALPTRPVAHIRPTLDRDVVALAGSCAPLGSPRHTRPCAQRNCLPAFSLMTFIYRSVAAVCPSWAGHIAAMPPLRCAGSRSQAAHRTVCRRNSISAVLSTNQFPQCAMPP